MFATPSVLATICSLAVSTADVPAASPYDYQIAPHAVATSATWLLLGIYQAVVRDELQGGLVCDVVEGGTRCDPANLNSLDRSVVGHKSNRWLLASDLTAAVLMLTSAAALGGDAFLAGSETPMDDFIRDGIVTLEATAVATLLAAIIKGAIRRPRPTAYADVGSVSSVEHQLSFPSGHSAATAAAASSWATTFFLRHPDSPWRWGVLAAASGLTGLTGYARVAGGFHFYTDVAAGVVLGAASGVTTALLLKRSSVAITPLALGAEAKGVGIAWRY